jgi:hypothetical protein
MKYGLMRPIRDGKSQVGSCAVTQSKLTPCWPNVWNKTAPSYSIATWPHAWRCTQDA